MAKDVIKSRALRRERIATSETLPYTLAAGASHGFAFPLGLTGYTPVALAGSQGSGTGKCTFADNYLESATIARLYIANPTSEPQTITALRMDVLYQANQ